MKNFALGCKSIMISLVPGATTRESRLQVRRSQDFYISADVKRFCARTPPVTSAWTMSNCSASNCTSMMLIQKIHSKPSELYIPPRTLDYGIYAFNLTVVILDDNNITASEVSYVEVSVSGITANLVPLGTSMVTHGRQQNLTLDPGSYSADPDREDEKFDPNVS